MRIVAIIPARMGSSRFPGKPMALIHRFPMIGHCYFRISKCPDVDETYVATCDQEIYDFIESIGGHAIMTSNSHERASDRAAEAMLKVEAVSNKKTDILVMAQGDEPMDTPGMVSEVLKPMLSAGKPEVVNLMGRIKTIREFEDPNTVKVVVDQEQNAIYFSREPIPSRRKYDLEFSMHKQICIIPFTRDYLLTFNSTKQTPLEIIESVDMLRVLESGHKVRMVYTGHDVHPVDTLEDLQKVQKLMASDSLMATYI